MFLEAVTGASDAPPGEAGAALGRLLYLTQLLLIFGWLMDRSENQRATHALLASSKRVAPAAALALLALTVRSFVRRLDMTLQEGWMSPQGFDRSVRGADEDGRLGPSGRASP